MACGGWASDGAAAARTAQGPGWTRVAHMAHACHTAGYLRSLPSSAPQAPHARRSEEFGQLIGELHLLSAASSAFKIWTEPCVLRGAVPCPPCVTAACTPHQSASVPEAIFVFVLFG